MRGGYYLEGIIVKAVGGFYDVRADDNKIYRCKARGRFRKDSSNLFVGDRVRFTPMGDDEGVVEKIMPRKNRLIRPPIVNVDMVIIFFSLKDPILNFSLLDRILVLAESNYLEALICLNKVDLVEDEDIPACRIYRSAGYQVILTSALTGQGVEEVKGSLKDKISVFTGPSGSGKSTFLNRIQTRLKLKVGDISAKTRRGKQTTRQVELLPFDFGGLVADSPGFSQLDLKDIGSDELPFLFPEISRLSAGCKFSGCSHEHEPSCAVKEALNRGEISQSRYKNYLTLLNELREKERSY